MRLLYIFILSLFPLIANAEAQLASGDAWTIYATANGQTLKAILTSISGLMQSPSYEYLIAFVAILGFIGFAVMSAVNVKKIEQFIGILIFIVAITQFAIKQKADVVIWDPMYGVPYTVQNVPAGIAIPISLISTAGHTITTKIEQYFTTPGPLKVSQSGTINMGSSLIKDISSMKINDANLSATMANFSNDCILPSIAQGRLTGSAIVSAPQLFKYGGSDGILKAVNPALLTTVYGQENGIQTQTVINCGPGAANVNGGLITYEGYNGNSTISASNAYEYISRLIEVGAPYQLAASRGMQLGTPAFNWLENAVSSAQTYLTNGQLTASGGNSVRQAAAVNMLADGLSTAVAKSGDSALTSSVALAQATQSQKSNWVMSAAIFNDISGYIFSLLQALMIALTPLILIAAFIPGTKMKILITAGQVFIWLALWQPTFAILNFIITEYAQGPYGGMVQSNNYTMMTTPIISQATDRFIAAAGFMGASIPMITWGLVKGGMALTSFVGGAMGGQLASAAGNMAATGNISLGNQSYDNYSANSTNAAGSMNLGFSAPSVALPTMGSNVLMESGGSHYLSNNSDALQRNVSSLERVSNALANNQSAQGQQMVSSGVSFSDSSQWTNAWNRTVSGSKGAETGQTTANADAISESEAYQGIQSAAQRLVKEGTAQTVEEGRQLVSAALQHTPQGNAILQKARNFTGGKRARDEDSSNDNPRNRDESSTSKGIFGVTGATRGENSRVKSGQTSTSVKDGDTYDSSTQVTQGGGQTETFSETEMAMAKLAALESFMRVTGLTKAEGYTQTKNAMASVSQGQQLQAEAKDITETSASLTRNAAPRSLAEMQSLLRSTNKEVNDVRADGVNSRTEAELLQEFDKLSGRIGQELGLDMSDGETLRTNAENATGMNVERVAPGGVNKGIEDIRSKTGTPGESAPSVQDVIQDRTLAYNEYMNNLAEKEKTLDSSKANLKDDIQNAREEAKALKNAGLYDFTRQYEMMTGTEKAVLGALVAATAANDLLGKGGETVAKGAATAATGKALQQAIEGPKENRGLWQKALQKADDTFDALKSKVGGKLDDAGELYRNLSKADAGDVMEFLNNDKVQDAFTKAARGEVLEGIVKKVGLSATAAATGIGSAATVLGAGMVAYDVVNYAGLLNSAWEQYQQGGSIDLSAFAAGEGSTAAPTSGPMGRPQPTGQAFEHNATKRTTQEAKDRVSQMDNQTARTFAQDNLDTLQNSGLLAYAPNSSGDTVLEALVKGDMTKREAVESGIVGESDFTGPLAQIPGLRD